MARIVAHHFFFEQTVPVHGMSQIFSNSCLFNSLGSLLLYSPMSNTVHLLSKTDKFFDWSTGCLTFHRSQHLFVDNAVKEVIFEVVSGVKLVSIIDHVLIYVGGSDVMQQ